MTQSNSLTCKCGAEVPLTIETTGAVLAATVACPRCGARVHLGGDPRWTVGTTFAAVLIAGEAVGLLILAATLKTFEGMYRDIGSPLPGPTKVLLHTRAPLFGAALLLVFGGVAAWLRSARRAWAGSALMWWLVLVGAAFVAASLVALYLPIFSLAGSIQQ